MIGCVMVSVLGGENNLISFQNIRIREFCLVYHRVSALVKRGQARSSISGPTSFLTTWQLGFTKS
jgi:hypothetical protein